MATALASLAAITLIALPVAGLRLGTSDASTDSTLRDSLIPRAEHGSGLAVHAGGQTAAAIDFAHALGSKLPLFTAVVVLLAFALLAAVFRSPLIPLVASALNLPSAVAALGAITAVFTRGWGTALLGLPGTGPADALLPVVMSSVLFGLSTDYEVYTVSRMHEEWRRLRSRPEGAACATTPPSPPGRRTAPASSPPPPGIMILVLGSFLPGGHHLLQEFGLGLGISVLIDASRPGPPHRNRRRT